VPRRTSPRQAVLLGVTGVVIGLVILVGLAILASRGSVELQGSPVFDAGRTDSQADAIRRGGPIPFPDVAGGDRSIYLQHLGDDDDRGWLAFDAAVPGAPGCVVNWVPESEAFVDSCSDERYPPDGEGLGQYPVRVRDGRLTVDLRRD
jgi:hypothetical protein